MVIGVAPGDYTDPTVLLDGIADMAGGEYDIDVTLPDIECDNCTLQVIQVMTDKPPYVSGYVPENNDIYYQCADLVLVAGGGPDGGAGGADGGTVVLDGSSPSRDGGSTGSGGDGGGCGCTAAGTRSSRGWPLLAASALLALTLGRRRRRAA